VSRVLLVLDLARPDELSVVRAALDVEFEAHGLRKADTFQAMHLGPDDEHIARRQRGAHLARHLRVVRAGVVAHARHEPARRLDAERIDELAPKLTECLGMDQQHALVVEPDAPVARRKMQARHEIAHVGKSHGIDVGVLGLDHRQMVSRQSRFLCNLGHGEALIEK